MTCLQNLRWAIRPSSEAAGPDPGLAAEGEDAARRRLSMASMSGSGFGPGVWARISGRLLGSPKRLVPRIGGIMSQSLAVSASVGADLEDVAGQSRGAGDELDPPFRLELAVAGMDLDGQDVGQIGVSAQPPGAEAGTAAEHDQPRPLLDGLGQELAAAWASGNRPAGR